MAFWTHGRIAALGVAHTIPSHCDSSAPGATSTGRAPSVRADGAVGGWPARAGDVPRQHAAGQPHEIVPRGVGAGALLRCTPLRVSVEFRLGGAAGAAAASAPAPGERGEQAGVVEQPEDILHANRGICAGADVSTPLSSAPAAAPAAWEHRHSQWPRRLLPHFLLANLAPGVTLFPCRRPNGGGVRRSARGGAWRRARRVRSRGNSRLHGASCAASSRARGGPDFCRANGLHGPPALGGLEDDARGELRGGLRPRRGIPRGTLAGMVFLEDSHQRLLMLAEYALDLRVRKVAQHVLLLEGHAGHRGHGRQHLLLEEPPDLVLQALFVWKAGHGHAHQTFEEVPQHELVGRSVDVGEFNLWVGLRLPALRPPEHRPRLNLRPAGLQLRHDRGRHEVRGRTLRQLHKRRLEQTVARRRERQGFRGLRLHTSSRGVAFGLVIGILGATRPTRTPGARALGNRLGLILGMVLLLARE
mmetsp:Transcript_16056/g.55879  ORF Transcript_16056/g.55879 Transcript_16056/m.55879 type:complete len:474 (-) Transcript_16056:1564-2985(-)